MHDMAREGNKLEQTKYGKITFSLQYINFSNIWSRFGAENIRSLFENVDEKDQCLVCHEPNAFSALQEKDGSHNSAQNGMERWYQNCSVFTLRACR